jgi:MFS family permease
VLLMGAFVARQATAAKPLLPLRLFESRNVTGANIIQFLMVAGMFGMFFSGVLFMQRVLGYDAVETGFAFLPVSLGIGILSLGFSANLTLRFGARNVLLAGLALLVPALALLARAPVDASYWVDVLPSMVLLGVGAGVVFPALTTLAMSTATPTDAGLASGLLNTTLQVGGAVGLSVLATLATSRTETLLADGESTAEALTSGYHLAFGVAAGILVAAIVVAVTVLRPQSAQEEAMAGEPAYSEAA